MIAAANIPNESGETEVFGRRCKLGLQLTGYYEAQRGGPAYILDATAGAPGAWVRAQRMPQKGCSGCPRGFRTNSLDAAHSAPLRFFTSCGCLDATAEARVPGTERSDAPEGSAPIASTLLARRLCGFSRRAVA